MTREERDKREAEKKARMEGSPDLGGVALPFSRAALLKFYWAFVLLFPAWTLWNARQNLTFETTFAGSVLFVACVLPAWFWCSGRVMGLPIFPIFALNLLPSYVTPLWQGHSLLAKYAPNEINTAAWTVAGFLFVAQLFWQQMAVRAVGIPGQVRMINLKKSEKILLFCVFFELLFEVLTFLLWQLGGSAFSSIRGFATAAGRMGIFVFSYRLGQGDLNPFTKILFLSMLIVIVIQETASLVLATAMPTLGIAFAAYVLGSGKIPWKAISATLVAITILHAGKFEMREKYLFSEEKRSASWAEYPAYFAEWIGYGLTNLGKGKAGEEKKEVSSVKERGSLIHLMVLIQKMTPSQVPYLEGATYEFIPSLLVPRILSPGKKLSHTGNMILSLHYGLLSEEGIWKTSIGFDPIMEAYANYGFFGVFGLAIIFGFFQGWVTKLTINVPMLSFGFLFGVLVIGTNTSGWNTAGVYVTGTWQSFLALVALSFVLMGKLENPVWKYYAIKLAEKLKFKKDAKLKKMLEDVEAVAGPVSAEDGGQRAEDGLGIGDRGLGEAAGGQGSVVSGHPSTISENPATVPIKHERPTRFIYSKNRK